MQVSLKDDEEAKGEAPVSERNESSENNDSSAQSEKVKIPLMHSEKMANDFNLSVQEGATPVINTFPIKPQDSS